MGNLYFVYILASKRNGTLYIGVTNNLIKRVWEHKENLVEGFTKKYQIHLLVCYENHTLVTDAIIREKYLKGKSRKYKLQLIENFNSSWNDLYEEIIK